jgi:hypothetical protein
MKLSRVLISLVITFALVVETDLLKATNCNTNCNTNNPNCSGTSLSCQNSGCGAGCQWNNATTYNGPVPQFKGAGLTNQGVGPFQNCWTVYACIPFNINGQTCLSPGCAISAGSVCNNSCTWNQAQVNQAQPAQCGACGERITT